jgi:tRNA pseudouridine38-40 synthase
LIEIRVLGNSFIHQQVRRMIGLMVNISQGKNIPSKIEDVLASEERQALSLVAPTNGLYLSKILYPDGLFDLEQKNQKIEAKYVNSLK